MRRDLTERQALSSVFEGVWRRINKPNHKVWIKQLKQLMKKIPSKIQKYY